DDHARFGGDRHARVHDVSLDPDSLAASVYGTTLRVNSLHHQAVDRLGGGLVVAGRSPDGTVEAVEMPGRAVLAVQWHPESLAGDPGPAWLVAAAGGGQRNGR
ncbi:gamma-glutamyl-gamma-aminobutyrate hydrolase family protein, partial [Acidimicrobiaceae bacterium USS-CC1]|nr:gamma-glutamyl-gamma-aminobutyrate hydrolase family protein [Acidiferrimicrobium australe]